MKWAAAGSLIERYAASQSWGPLHRQHITATLRNFQRHAVQYDDRGQRLLKRMRGWLISHLSWDKRYRRNRARHIWRFLDFLAAEKLIPRNPLSSLRRDYSLRGEGGVLDALSQTDWRAALRNLRRVPRFASRFASRILDMIELKRTLGARYISQVHILATFDRFVRAHPNGMTAPLEDLVRAWVQATSNPKTAYHRHQVGRSFCAYMCRIEPRTRLPVLPRRLRTIVEQTKRLPHIVTAAEMRKILEAALQLPSPRSPGRPETLRVILLVLFCTGLRLGECARFRLRDFDGDERLLYIRETKFFKSRLVPLSKSVFKELFAYLTRRRSLGWGTDPEAPLFCKADGSAWGSRSLDYLLAVIFRRAGLKPPHGKVGLRPHDLRHSFATGRVIQWYRDGVDVNARLPYLSTYLGHVGVASTQVYLSLTHDLMGEASQRFHRRYSHVLKGGDHA